ncbi:MAG: DUF433 domain-containing protein [Gemmatimonadetes bacterium]|nr:DUF433 domain-containing protein [Gemmatimonadota bacterium]
MPARLQQEIEREMERRGITEWSAAVVELLDEAIRMRRAPGVVFVDGPRGRRAVVAGTGVDVWEIVASWREVGEDYRRLRAAYEWMAEPQLRAALSYYEFYPEEVDARIALEERWTQERVQRELPFTTPRP